MDLRNVLSPEQLDELLKRYEEGAPIKRLIEDYKLGIPVNQFSVLLPPVPLEMDCRHCSMHLSQKRLPRSAATSRWYSPSPPFCEYCGHREYPSGSSQVCDCAKCSEIRRGIENERRRYNSELIGSYVKRTTSNPMKYSELCPMDMISLSAILRSYGDEDCAYICADRAAVDRSRQASVPFCAPSLDDEQSIIERLWRIGAIAVSEQSSIDAFYIENINGTPQIVSVYPFKIHWDVIVTDIPPTGLLSPKLNCSSEEKLFLWKELSRMESVAYLDEERSAVELYGKVGTKTLDVIGWMVDVYSTSEIYFFIWASVRDAVHQQVRDGLLKSHAANLVITILRRKAERYFENKFEPKKYRRLRPQSELSRIIYYDALNLGDSGFYMIPKVDNLNGSACIS